MVDPQGADAPVRVWPRATVAMIAISIAVFAVLMAKPDAIESLALVHGQGLHPVQWITANFVHGNIIQLLGNMICLWVFGRVIEGKLGWQKTIAVMLCVGIVQCAAEQLLTLGSSGGRSFGATAIGYGLIAVALSFRLFASEAMVAVFVGVLLLVDVATIILSDAAITSAALHMMGAAVGVAAASVLFKYRLVDCEYRDLIAEWRGYDTTTPAERDRAITQSPEYQKRREQFELERRAEGLAEIRKIIDSGQAELAAKAHERMAGQFSDWRLPEADLLRLIESLYAMKLWSESARLMRQYLSQQYTKEALSIRLRLAHILITSEKRPALALKVLAKIDAATLEAGNRDRLETLRAEAQRLHEEDPYEMSEEV